jgi:NitT/TauT family transport system permease protein
MKLARFFLLFSLSITAWEFAGRQFSLVSILISTPLRTVRFVYENWFSLAQDLGHTFGIAAIGLFGAVVVGGLISLYAILHPRFSATVQGVATVLQAIPLIVFAPFLIILFGVGVSSKAILAAMMAVFPIVLGLINAGRQAEAEYRELAMFYDLSPLEAVLRVYLPVMFPSIVGDIRVASSLALLGAVIAEFTGSAMGLGRNIFLGTVRVDPELLVSSLILTGFLGLAIHSAMRWVEEKATWLSK